MTQVNNSICALRKEVPMCKFVQIIDFTKLIFVDKKSAKTSSHIVEGILLTQSFRINDIADAMDGNEVGDYKIVRSFLKQESLHIILNRLINEDSKFVIPPK